MSSHAPQLKKSKRGIALPVLLFYSRCEAPGPRAQTNEVGLSFGGEGVRPHSIVRGSKFGGYACARVASSPTSSCSRICDPKPKSRSYLLFHRGPNRHVVC